MIVVLRQNHYVLIITNYYFNPPPHSKKKKKIQSSPEDLIFCGDFRVLALFTAQRRALRRRREKRILTICIHVTYFQSKASTVEAHWGRYINHAIRHASTNATQNMARAQVTSVSLVRGIIILNQKEGTTDNGQTHLTSTSHIKLQLLIQHKCDTLITVYINTPGKTLGININLPPSSWISHLSLLTN